MFFRDLVMLPVNKRTLEKELLRIIIFILLIQRTHPTPKSRPPLQELFWMSPWFWENICFFPSSWYGIAEMIRITLKVNPARRGAGYWIRHMVIFYFMRHFFFTSNSETNSYQLPLSLLPLFYTLSYLFDNLIWHIIKGEQPQRIRQFRLALREEAFGLPQEMLYFLNPIIDVFLHDAGPPVYSVPSAPHYNIVTPSVTMLMITDSVGQDPQA